MKKVFRSKRIPAPGSNYSPGFDINNLLFFSGLLATDYKVGVPPEAKTAPEFPWFGSNVKLQAEYVLRNLTILLEDAGSSLEDLLRANILILNLNLLPDFLEVWEKYFTTHKPAITVVEVRCEGYYGQGLLGSMGNLFEVEGIAMAKGSMKKEMIRTETAPQFMDYPAAARAGGFIITGGLSATDYKSGIPPKAKINSNFPWFGSDIKLETKYILNQLKTILKAGGSSLENVVKANIYLTDLHDYFQFDEVWEKYFPKNPPARTITEVKGLLGAKGNRIHIEAIAAVPDAGVEKQVINSKKIPRASKSYSSAAKAGGILFTSGMCATDYKTGLPPSATVNPNYPWSGLEVKRQVKYTLDNLKTLMEEIGGTMDDIAKCTMYLTDLRDYDGFANSLPTYFSDVEPSARTVFEVNRILGPVGARFEIEAVATAD